MHGLINYWYHPFNLKGEVQRKHFFATICRDIFFFFYKNRHKVLLEYMQWMFPKLYVKFKYGFAQNIDYILNQIICITGQLQALCMYTWDAGRTPRTGNRRVNSYLIVYQR